jgi:oligoendopeptidase F
MSKSNLTWDLEAIYSNPKDWDKDFDCLQALAEKFASFQGRLAESAEVLAQAFEANDNLSRLAEKLYTYAHLKSDEDTSINCNRARVDKLRAKFANLAPLETWFDPEFAQIPEEKVKEFMTQDVLKLYKRTMSEMLRTRIHTLSNSEEKMLGILSDVHSSSAKTFETLNDADLDFGKIKNDENKSVPLTHGSYRTFLESSDRATRKRAFDKLYKTYKKFRNTFASTLEGCVKLHNAKALLRNYSSSLAASLEGDNVPESIYRNLIATVHDNLGPLQDYLKLRSEILKIDNLDMYDMFNPLVPSCKKEYSFKEAEELVKAAFLQPLGKEYVDDLSLAFSQRWIDVEERPGKRSGAYSGGCYDTYPYVLLNYNNTLNDVFTLAHELGHSMHSFYSKKTQPYHSSDYEIFVAEVASTVNEVLLYEYLMETSKDKDFRIYLGCHMADEIRGTIYRQTMFAEFELLIHEDAANNIPLTADYLSKKYYELNKLYHNDGIANPDKLIELEWARIPHFYYNFYVYKYATGMSAALRIASNLKKNVPGAREKYLKFLSSGDSKDVLDLLIDTGVDLNTSEPVEAALSYFDTVVQNLRKELNK